MIGISLSSLVSDSISEDKDAMWKKIILLFSFCIQSQGDRYYAFDFKCYTLICMDRQNIFKLFRLNK